MYIVINCLGLPFNGDTIKTKSLGGSETAAYYVARELAKRGHKITLFTASRDEGVFEDVRYVWAGDQTQESPLGERFHFYALRTQHDVCIVQRHPGAFGYRWASKINLLWLHDLASYRGAGAINNTLWNVDGILPVSAWHGKQVQEVWGINPDIIYPVRNGVDLNLWNNELVSSSAHVLGISSDDSASHKTVGKSKFKLLYAARPERGLENLVRPDGIMDRLSSINSDYHLYFCSYDNVAPDMRPYYEQLWAWAEERGNCTNLGALTKQELAGTERKCDLYVYPTTFEDTSCIMAMECAAAGLPFLSCEVGALPETCISGGYELLKLKDGAVNIAGFVQVIKNLRGEQNDLQFLASEQLATANLFSWERAADTFEDAITKCFTKAKSGHLAVLKHFEHVSDIYALWEYAKRNLTTTTVPGETAYLNHIDEVYSFARDNNFAKHYEDYYAYEKQRGVNYGPENLNGNHRFESVAGIVSRLPAGSVVLDYGCAHGHYTINLAKRFPQFRFVGVDIAESNVNTARKWAETDGVPNVQFFLGSVRDGELQASCEGRMAAQPDSLNCVIAAEVLEHVANPTEITDVLCEYLKPDGLFIATTPYGPWEAVGYEEHHPWRAHLWHFERGDLSDMYSMHPAFKVVSAFHGIDKRGEVLGSYITTFNKPTKPSGRIDYDRKFAAIAPRQTVALCAIVKDAESTIRQMLLTAVQYVDEVVIGVDNTTTDDTADTIIETLAPYQERGQLTYTVMPIPSPMEVGFDAARNLVVEKATSQWVFWPDADEVLVHADQMHKYLRNNQYHGYAVALRHLSIDPPGLLRTDLPTKLFRNHRGAKFFGKVHEHPEVKLNDGVGHVTIANDIDLGHYSYTTEEVRRGRFHRNINLLVRDREDNPDRLLGKYLWIRDLAQMCQWEHERNGGVITPAMVLRAEKGLALWEEILDGGHVRMLLDAMDFYSSLSKIIGGDEGFECAFKLDTSKMNGGVHLERVREIKAFFAKKDHATKLFSCLFNERTKVYDSKYY